MRTMKVFIYFKVLFVKTKNVQQLAALMSFNLMYWKILQKV